MPKDNAYRATDHGFWGFIYLLTEELNYLHGEEGLDSLTEEDSKYLLTGGAGVQLSILHWLTKGGELPVEKAIKSQEEYAFLITNSILRPTRDLDFIMYRVDGRNVVNAAGRKLNGEHVMMDGSSSCEGGIELKVSRVGHTRMTYSIYECLAIEGNRWDSGKHEHTYDVWATFAYNGKKIAEDLPEGFYEERFTAENRERLQMDFRGVTIDVLVPKPEYLLTLKIAKGRPRDKSDTQALVWAMTSAGGSLDMVKMEALLSETGETLGKYMDFSDLVEKIQKNPKRFY